MKKVNDEIVSSATLGKARITPQKVRLVLDMVRGKQVDMALQVLRNSPKKAARMVEKLLRSAIANAEEQAQVDLDNLWVSEAWANMAKASRVMLYRARGKADILRKRNSCITIKLGERA